MKKNNIFGENNRNKKIDNEVDNKSGESLNYYKNDKSFEKYVNECINNDFYKNKEITIKYDINPKN